MTRRSATAAVMRGAFADVTARRSSFWLQIAVMIVNDVAWVGFWLLFFNRVGSVRGWDADLVLLLFAVLTTSAGLVLGLLTNCRRIPSLIEEGALDEVLSLPTSPLRQLLVQRVDTVNLGDLAFGIALFGLTADPTPQRVVVYVLGTLASAVVLTGFLVAVGSVAFLSGRSQAADLGLNAVLLLASYPADIFGGATKAVLYTVIPAAFVAAVPARLIENFALPQAVLLAVVAIGFAGFGRLAFTLGLRRYSSGSAWGLR
jgi:ABC-2 type transport system permease protein